MPSKGLDVYTYINHPTPVEIVLSVPGRDPIFHRDNQAFRVENLEIESSAICWPLRRQGRFELVVRRDGRDLTRQFLDIDPITGAVDEDSSMDNLLLESRSFVDGRTCVGFGAYQAGPGGFGMPNRHQVNVVVTKNHSRLIGELAPPGSPQAERPFVSLVLPAAHDVGMNGLDTVHALIANAGPAAARALAELLPEFFSRVAPAIGSLLGGVSDRTVARIAPDIVASLAVTQKDSVAAMCAMGMRYAEFRPAYCHSALAPHLPFPNRLFFQHGPIPGMGYAEFLRDVVTFLRDHPDEIMVVHVRWDGVPAECRRPDAAELGGCLDEALRGVAGAEDVVRVGGLDDLRRAASIRQLREQRKRLLMIVDCPGGEILGTYDDVANATLDGRSILAAFERVLDAKRQERALLTVAQCQATPSNIPDAVKYSVSTADASTLLLMATKARCGHLMLPWLRANAGRRCRKDRCLVLMDDFLDGAVADVAAALSRERLAG